MRRGVFQEYEGTDGARVFKLRWVDEIELSPEEMARGRFIQFLIAKGRLSEYPDSPADRSASQFRREGR